MSAGEAKEYLARREIPQLFESLLNGLMCYKPDDPIEYLESCLQKVKELGGPEKVKWDTFVSPEKKTLPPLNGGQSRRSFFRNVMPDNSNFPYRRYDRLPPIQQFSIESDTDLSETAELIEEYDVFDPARPRPKIILVIARSIYKHISQADTAEFDADRDEEEVFSDISSAVDNKLFANKETAAGTNEFDCNLIMDSGDAVYTEFDFEDQIHQRLRNCSYMQ
ncbi:hypothetical protein DV515_00004857 [Chloebia gouldiae]|uniref:Uncharacterized protein n=1 Tax=Chloebia gouldiae TaxID=44316 RepID=A0A3L8SPB2_CHLGU|nr:hypothetical protein DV515_00004857 [Chloebia gouldiae]